MKNVVLIGAGKRMHETVIPALTALSDRYTITGILSRTVRKIQVSDSHSYITQSEFHEIDWNSTDIIIMAATTSSNPSLLHKLSKYNLKHTTLIIDTPILEPAAFFSLRYLAHFKKVVAGEDFFFLPPYVTVRNILDEQHLVPSSIYFYKNAYRYHALAALRRLVGPLDLTSVRQVNSQDSTTLYARFNNVVAVVQEPRDYPNAYFSVETHKGIITDQTQHPNENLHSRISYVRQNTWYVDISVNGSAVVINDMDDHFQKILQSLPVHVGFTETMKIRAYMDLLIASEDDRIESYSVVSAFFDNLIIKIVEKIGVVPLPKMLLLLLQQWTRNIWKIR